MQAKNAFILPSVVISRVGLDQDQDQVISVISGEDPGKVNQVTKEEKREREQGWKLNMREKRLGVKRDRERI